MTITKKASFDNYKDVFSEEIEKYYKCILRKFKPKKKKILLFVQCSKIKPYSNSPSHKYIRKAITELTGFDPYDFPEKNPIQIIVISSLIGPVPYENESDYIPSHYNLSVNRIAKEQFREIEPILVNRISNFLLKIKDNYQDIIFFVKNNYRTICEKVRKDTNINFIISPSPELHMIREAWIELKYKLLELLKERLTIQPISKTLLFDVLRNVALIGNGFSLNDFRGKFNLKKKSDKQIYNYLLTFRRLNIVEKNKSIFKIHNQYLDYLSKNHVNSTELEINDIKTFRDYILIYSDLKFNFKYILYQLYKHSALKKDILCKKMNVNGFSMNLFLEILQWLDLIKMTNGVSYLTTEAKTYLNEDKYLKLIDKFIKITDFSKND